MFFRFLGKKAAVKALCSSLLAWFCLAACSDPSSVAPSFQDNHSSFVTVEDDQFVLEGKPYHYAGANFWHAGYLGLPEQPGDRERLKRELDLLKAHGITNLRVLAMSEDSQLLMALRPAIQSGPGEVNHDLLVGLDYLLDEMAKREMKAVLYLNNFWQWSGGMSQYVSWLTGEPVFDPDVTGDWNGFMMNSARFYRLPEAQAWYRDVIKAVVERKNSINGKAYHQDPTIMSWELANEPRPGSDADGAVNADVFVKWVDDTANYIHSLAPQQLVTTGSEGTMGTIRDEALFVKTHSLASIDYATFHLWVKNWSWFDVTQPEETFDKALANSLDYIDLHLQFAKQMNKPIVFEEFGVERDGGSFEPISATTWRDKFLQAWFDRWYQAGLDGLPAAGTNFWAWSGEARTTQKDYIWQQGDTFFGDPPQEPQGLNSVFDTDSSTLMIMKKHAAQMLALSERE